MTVIFIGNYLPDKQESMQRFTNSLQRDVAEIGMRTIVWIPPAVTSRYSKSTNTGLGKWLGYIDKWLLFPLIISGRRYLKGYNSKNFLFHICDHSNAPYLQWLPRSRTLITCHDVLAIRGGLGYADAYCPATATGKILQKWILGNLLKARWLTTVSNHTMQQLRELDNHNKKQPISWQVVYNSFNGQFWPMAQAERNEIAGGLNPHLQQPFLLHVGSDLPRKNRKLLIDMLSAAGDNWNGLLCLAGDPAEPELQQYIQQKGVEHKVVLVVKPTHQQLVALYSSCFAFVFPSFSEGFGWPLIEAQACGTPVIVSNIMPMPEVGGEAALYANPYDGADFANALAKLQNKAYREELVRKGFDNCKRFDNPKITGQYLHLYKMMEQA